MPEAYFTIPLSNGPLRFQVGEKVFYKMLDKYYKFRGWEPEVGVPTRTILKALGVWEVAEELEKPVFIKKKD